MSPHIGADPLQDNACLLGDLARAQGDLNQAQENLRGLRPLKEELGFAHRRVEERGRCLVEQDAAVLQLTTTNEMLQNKVDELLAAKQQLELMLAKARSSVTAQEPVVASILARFGAAAHGPDVAANPTEGALDQRGGRQKKQQGQGLKFVAAGCYMNPCRPSSSGRGVLSQFKV